MNTIETHEILNQLDELTEWKLKDNAIGKTFIFDSYMDGIQFINKLAKIAEKANHHPDMIVRWCKIYVSYTSHDQGKVTSSCIQMAKETDSIQ